jgi:hypothetical protein
LAKKTVIPADPLGHHSPENLFWITKHGIKMTGMPAWGETHGDEELWDVVAFINQLGQMTPQQYQELTHASGESGHSHGPRESGHGANAGESNHTHQK